MNGKKPPRLRERLSREDWIDGAITFLSTHGVDSLRLDTLAARLGVTKGSFYYHFASRDELIEAVLSRWHSGISSEVTRVVVAREGAPLDRLRKLITMVFADEGEVPGGPFEMTLRGWARRNVRVREIMQHVDASRIAEIQAFYLEAGVSRELATAFAVIHITFITGSGMMLAEAGPEEIERRRDIALRYLVDAFDVTPKKSRGGG